jgi:hypothetical protein
LLTSLNLKISSRVNPSSMTPDVTAGTSNSEAATPYHPSLFLTEFERLSKRIKKSIHFFKLCEI